MNNHPRLDVVNKNGGCFLVARHSVTDKHDVDKDRCLTTEGELLAVAAGRALKQHERLLGGRFSMVFASPARRCQMTAQFMLPSHARFATLNAIYPNTPEGRANYPNLLQTFGVHGNKSVQDYCGMNKDCKQEFDRYVTAVLAEMAMHKPKGNEKYVGIMAHAVLAPAIALEIARQYRCVPLILDSLEAMVLSECDAILLSPFFAGLVRAKE